LSARFSLLCTLVALSTAVLPTGLSAPSSGTILFSPPGNASGNLTATVGDRGFFAAYRAGPDGQAAIDLEGQIATLSLNDTIDEFLHVGNFQACAPPCVSTYQNSSIPAAKVRLSVDRTLANFTFIFAPFEPAKISFPNATVQSIVEHPVLSAGPSRKDSIEPYAPTIVSWPNRYLVDVDGLVHHLLLPTASAEYTGRFFFLISDATVHLTNDTGPHELRTGKWKETLAAGPTGLSQPRDRFHHVALVGVVSGTIRFSYTGPYGHLLAPALTVGNVSRLSVPLTNATVDVGGTRYESSGQPFLDVEGRFDLALPDAASGEGGSVESNRIRAALSGDIVRIAENRLTTHSFPVDIVAATAAGLGLLAAVYVVVSFLRRGAVYVAVRALEFKLFTFAPFAARLDLAKVLEHPVRKGIMDMLAGAHAMRNLADLRRDVAASFGVSSMAAYFHLRTLWRANHLTVVRMKGRHFIGPNSGGMGPKEQRVAASLLQHPVGFAIAEFVCRHPGTSQKELVAYASARAEEAGPDHPTSYSAILAWIRKFERVRIVPTHLVQAFGSSLNPGVEAKDVQPVPVSLIVRRPDPHDARVLRYEPTDVLYDVLQTFTERRHDLGTALTELTRLQVHRRDATATRVPSTPQQGSARDASPPAPPDAKP
jgi:hypothetical protein